MAKTMTSRQRLLAAIRHEEPDRVPVVPRHHAYCMARYGDHLLENQLRMIQEFGWDYYIVIPSLTDALWPNYAWNLQLEDVSPLERAGVKLDLRKEEEKDRWLVQRSFHTPAGTLKDRVVFPKPGCGYGIRPNAHFLEHLVKDREDLERVRYLLLDPQKYTDFETLRKAKKLVGNRGLVMAYTNSPLDNKAGCVFGSENLMMSYYDDRTFCRELLEMFHHHCQRETQALLEQGVDGIHTTWYWSSISGGWSPAMIDELFLPLAREHIDLVHRYDGIYYYYDDGKVMELAERLKELRVDILGTCAPPPMGDVDLGSLKGRIGDSVCLHGNTDIIYVLMKGTPRLVEQSVEESMRAAAPGSGFIMGTSDSIREGTPEQNIRSWTEAAKRYGVYPVEGAD